MDSAMLEAVCETVQMVAGIGIALCCACLFSLMCAFVGNYRR